MIKGGTAPCWFFYGTDLFKAEEFAEEMHAALHDGRPDLPIERVYLDEISWADILDSARNSPLLFSPGRVIVVKAPDPKDNEKAKDKGENGGKSGNGRKKKKDPRQLDPEDEKLLSAYLSAPPDRTALIVLVPGESPRRRPTPLVKFFTSRPSSQVRSQELKPLKDVSLKSWAAGRARRLGKTFDPAALNKFCELSSGDMRRMDAEIGKLAVFIGEKMTIGLEDVCQIVPWVTTLGSFDLDDALEGGGFRRVLAVLDASFSSGHAPPEAVLGKINDLLGNVLRAKALLAEGKTPKEIYALLYPYIREHMGDFYRQKFDAFFAVVRSLETKRLNALLQALREADFLLKRSDVPDRVVLDAFLFRYCRMREKRGVSRTSFPPRRGPAG